MLGFLRHPNLRTEDRLCVSVTTIKKRGQIRGRAVDPTAIAEVGELVEEISQAIVVFPGIFPTP